VEVDDDIQIADLSSGLKWDEGVGEFGPLFVTDMLILADHKSNGMSSAFLECYRYSDFYRDVSE